MIRVAINGFGRIGRLTLRRFLLDKNVQVVAINDLTTDETLVHLFKYDSVHGRFDGDLSYSDGLMNVNGSEIKMFAQPDPEKLPWKELNVDVVIESTGFFTKMDGASKHITAGAKKVIISAPSKDDEIPTIVIGVNHDTLTGSETVVSNASCTTNCLAPIIKVLDVNFGVEKGFMTTIHAYTSTQNIVDGPLSDLRRARAGAHNIIPTTTGATNTVEKVYPKVKGKLHGIAARVPVPDGSLTDLTVVLDRDVTAEEVNQVLKTAAEGDYKGVMEYTDEPIVSSDILTNPHSCIVDSLITSTKGNLVKLVAWYDNEYGYASRTADLVKYLGL